MKKKCVTLLCLTLLCFAFLTGCVDKSKDYINTSWAYSYGKSLDGSIALVDEQLKNISVEFKDKDNCTINLFGESVDCTWNLDRNIIYLNSDDLEEEIRLIIEDDYLKYGVQGGYLLLEKNK